MQRDKGVLLALADGFCKGDEGLLRMILEGMGMPRSFKRDG
jgi:hypothetical protein